MKFLISQLFLLIPERVSDLEKDKNWEQKIDGATSGWHRRLLGALWGAPPLGEQMMSDNTRSAVRAGAVVARDTERFKLLYKNGRPVLPAGYNAPLGMTFIRTLIRENDAAKTCG